MSGEIAAAGEVVTGMLAARVVEPGAGDAHGHGHAARGALCLNCGTRLIGEHCHRCGQSGHVHRTVGAIGHELLHGVFHFEGKIWRTLPMLFFRPGELTRRYVAGERARFVSPLALFLFSVFLMFASLGLTSTGDFGQGMAEGFSEPRSVDLARRLAAKRKELAAAEARLSSAPTNDREDAQGDVRELREDAAKLMARLRDAKSDKMIDSPKTGWVRLDKGIEKANKDPAFLGYKLQSSAYKYSWLLIILSTPFVSLLFLWRRRFGLYDHAVFVTYSLSFMMIFVVTLILAGLIHVPEQAIAVTGTVTPPLHMYKQLRGAYSLRRRSALWRTMVLTMFAGAILLTFFLLILLQGLTG